VIDIANPFFTDVVLGAEDHFHQAGYAVHVGNSAQTADREVAHLALFEEQRVRGILLAPIREMTERIAELRRRGIAVVLVDQTNGNDTCSVGVDDLEGGRLAAQHLIDQGHRSIAFVGGPSTLHQVRDRRTGAELACARAREPVILLAVSTPSLDVESGIRAAVRRSVACLLQKTSCTTRTVARRVARKSSRICRRRVRRASSEGSPPGGSRSFGAGASALSGEPVLA